MRGASGPERSAPGRIGGLVTQGRRGGSAARLSPLPLARIANTTAMQDFEKLGLFYLGRSFDVAAGKATDDLVLYDSRNLVTHAVCVGMTGSGKTGLCLSLLEEAAIDHVPAIAIDPKGDLSNLLLTFPNLKGEDFAPWVDEGEARRQGTTTAEFAEKQAALWKQGLADWGEDGARIQRLRDSAEFRVYTPGSQAGLPISILGSFGAAPRDPRGCRTVRRRDRDDRQQFARPARHRRRSFPKSRAHPAFQHPRERLEDRADLDVGALIPLIQSPPFAKVGVLDTDSFFPSKERFALGMKLNNLLAAPGFEAWLKGEPLDIDAMLHAPDGKPRISIVSIAHLAESERMFFVSLLLNQVLSWVAHAARHVEPAPSFIWTRSPVISRRWRTRLRSVRSSRF